MHVQTYCFFDVLVAVAVVVAKAPYSLNGRVVVRTLTVFL